MPPAEDGYLLCFKEKLAAMQPVDVNFNIYGKGLALGGEGWGEGAAQRAMGVYLPP